jgi:hypothetical protein
MLSRRQSIILLGIVLIGFAASARAADVEPMESMRAAAGLIRSLPGAAGAWLPPMPSSEPVPGAYEPGTPATSILGLDDDDTAFGAPKRDGPKYHRYSLSPQMDLDAGIVKDENRGKLFGLQLRYRFTPSTSLTGRTGLNGAGNSPQGVMLFGLKVEF